MYQKSTRALFAKYAIPQMIGLLFNSVYLIVDGIFIGNRLGRDAMAAAAVSVPLIEILISLSMAVTSGAGILISSQLGRKEETKAVQTFNIAILAAAVAGFCIILFGNLFLTPLARLLGSTPAIHNGATEYMRYIVSFSPFLIFSFLLGGLARNDGCPRLAMAALALGSVSNIFLDYLFMYPLDMGIGGAALATALGPIFSVLILLPHFLLKKGTLYFSRFKFCVQVAFRILILGFPSFIMEFTIGMVTFVYNIAIKRYGYGEIGLASYLVIGYLMLIFLTVFLGMAEGLQPVFSYFTGTGEPERNREMRWFATKVFLAAGCLGYLLILLFSRNFFSIFTPEDIELIKFSQEKSIPYFSCFFLAGYNILMISFWQSTQCTRQALLVSLLRSLCLPPLLAFLLPLLWHRDVIWLCHSISEAITAFTAILILLSMKKTTGQPPRTTLRVCSHKGEYAIIRE